MRLWKRSTAEGSQFKPYALKIRDGHLIGLESADGNASPCARCVREWLKERHMDAEPVAIESVPFRDTVLPQLYAESSPHTLYEVSNFGTTTRLDCVVFPHRSCDCSKNSYSAPQTTARQLNFAFSPIHQLKCVRYTTPQGNAWLAAATGKSPLTQSRVSAFGVASDKEDARSSAVEEWLRRATVADLSCRQLQRERVAAFERSESGVEVHTTRALELPEGSLGVGANREAALLDGLNNNAKLCTLQQFATEVRKPMLVVGANSWLRQRVPFFLLQLYDIHFLFYPTSLPVWVVGVAAFSRTRTDEPPVFVFTSDANILTAMDRVIFKVLEHCRPPEVTEEFLLPKPDVKMAPRIAQLNLWWNHWIYRCAKISLSDVLHLEPHPGTVESWLPFYSSQNDLIRGTVLNNEYFPESFRSLVHVEMPLSLRVGVNRNVNGIGTWANFRETLLGR